MSRKRTNRKQKSIAIPLALAIAIITAVTFWMSPYWAVAGFTQATQSHDTREIAAYLDLDRLRDGLRRDAVALTRPHIERGRNKFWEAVGVAVGTALIDRAVEDHVNPENIAAVFAPYLQDYAASRATMALRLAPDNRARWLNSDTFEVRISADVAMTWERHGFEWTLVRVTLSKPTGSQT